MAKAKVKTGQAQIGGRGTRPKLGKPSMGGLKTGFMAMSNTGANVNRGSNGAPGVVKRSKKMY